MRNAGASIDTTAKTVRDRDGVVHNVDALEVFGDTLYYARAIDNWHFFYQERWVLPARGLVVNRFAFFEDRDDAIDWYIETDQTDVADGAWTIRDGYLDVFVDEGVRYHVDDAGELADAIVARDLPLEDVVAALRSLDVLSMTLRANGCSGHALLREFAPQLPQSRILRDGPRFTVQPVR